jgi:uncharacterized protein
MKNCTICKTAFNNYYLISQLGSYFIYLPVLLRYFIERGPIFDNETNQIPEMIKLGNKKYSKEEISYYYSKYMFLKDHGLINILKGPGERKFSGFITEDDIKWRLANLPQLVFEVTDMCNLKCKYCGYGELYNNHGVRGKNKMTFKTAKLILDYLFNLWQSEFDSSYRRNLTLGFYGGEPLLNIKLIKKIIKYIELLKPPMVNFTFSITTNGMLLDKNMDYLVSKNFMVLISLDGNEINNCYRIKHDSTNSFEQVYHNIKLLQQKYPGYFDSMCSLVSVLHNRNSVSDIRNFILNEFGKIPTILEVSSLGIDPKMQEEFNRIYRNQIEDIKEAKDCSDLTSSLEIFNPYFLGAADFVQHLVRNCFRRYSDLIEKEENRIYVPTGTCIPFERKMFITVSGEILTCERIGNKSILGRVLENKVELDLKGISLRYNNLYKTIRKQCQYCHNYLSCTKCLFRLTNFEEKLDCDQFQNIEQMKEYCGYNISFFESNPEAYTKAKHLSIE